MEFPGIRDVRNSDLVELYGYPIAGCGESDLPNRIPDCRDCMDIRLPNLWDCMDIRSPAASRQESIGSHDGIT